LIKFVIHGLSPEKFILTPTVPPCAVIWISLARLLRHAKTT
jgi:hypothetical protein